MTPVLLRDGPRVHISTPPLSQKGKEKDHDEVELDLGSLGLVDREIPPEDIIKLEKIGSGGFKEYVSFATPKFLVLTDSMTQCVHW